MMACIAFVSSDVPLLAAVLIAKNWALIRVAYHNVLGPGGWWLNFTMGGAAPRRGNVRVAHIRS